MMRRPGRTVINGLTFDGATKDPAQQAVRDALIAFMAPLSQTPAEATKEAQKAGIAHAQTLRDDAYRGRRPQFTYRRLQGVREMLARERPITTIAAATGVCRQLFTGSRTTLHGRLRRWSVESLERPRNHSLIDAS
jgi:putative DNA-invertase from lambdoid prophage Rac